MNEGKNDKEIKARHDGVLLEDIDSKLDILVEGQLALDAKIDKNHKEFREFASETNFKFGIVFEKFEEVDKKFEVVFKKFNDVDEQFRKVDDKFEIVFEELHELRKERVA